MRQPKKYKSKEVLIEAMHWNGDYYGASYIIEWILKYEGTASLRCGNECCYNELAIHVVDRQGPSTVEPQDYVIRDLETNEFYPCKPDTFAKKYTEVPVGH
jgi:hypothetical protein